MRWGVDMDTDLELCQARIIQGRYRETALLHRRNDISSAIIRCRPEHRIVPFGHADEHIALVLIQCATNQPTLVRPPGIAELCSYILGHQRGDFVLEPL